MATPVRPGSFTLQAVQRAMLRRSGGVHLPELGSQPPVQSGTFIYQALRRPYVGRTVPLRPNLPTHLLLQPFQLLVPSAPLQFRGQVIPGMQFGKVSPSSTTSVTQPLLMAPALFMGGLFMNGGSMHPTNLGITAPD